MLGKKDPSKRKKKSVHLEASRVQPRSHTTPSPSSPLLEVAAAAVEVAAAAVEAAAAAVEAAAAVKAAAVATGELA